MLENHLMPVRIVLVGTTHPGNIGAAARAMKTMGLSQLILVAPKIAPNEASEALAKGALDVLRKAVIVPSLKEALKDVTLAFATSARVRGIALPELMPDAIGTKILAQNSTSPVAIVFGRESSGLNNNELLQCHYHINIPANPEYASLNLAQAVQIIAYELRKTLLNPSRISSSSETRAASIGDVDALFIHLKKILIDIDFLDIKNPRRLEQRLRRLLQKTRLETDELHILRGILAHIEKKIRP